MHLRSLPAKAANDADAGTLAAMKKKTNEVKTTYRNNLSKLLS